MPHHAGRTSATFVLIIKADRSFAVSDIDNREGQGGLCVYQLGEFTVVFLRNPLTLSKAVDPICPIRVRDCEQRNDIPPSRCFSCRPHHLRLNRSVGEEEGSSAILADNLLQR
jgi:hypothetical protein